MRDFFGKPWQGKAMCQVLAWVVLMAGCESPDGTPVQAEKEVVDLSPQLRQARFELAEARFFAGDVREALARYAAMLRDEPDFTEAREAAEKLTRGRRWSVPLEKIELPFPVDHLALQEDSLWLGLSGEMHTLVRWDLAERKIGAILFPGKNQHTHTLRVFSGGQRLVVERGETVLLCDAGSLKPILELEKIPKHLARESVIASSADGVLFAHPVEEPGGIAWRIRDSNSGQIIRSVEPLPGKQPLAAHLNHQRLRVLHADGGIAEIPVSPVEPIAEIPLDETVTCRHAQFDDTGKNAVVSMDSGPLEAPMVLEFSTDGSEMERISGDWLEKFPWHRGPGIWSGLFRDAEIQLPKTGEWTVNFAENAMLSVHVGGGTTAIALSGERMVMAEDSGVVTIHRILPEFCGEIHVEDLAEALAGTRYEAESGGFQDIPDAERVEKLRELLPNGVEFQHHGKEAISPLLERLAQASPDGEIPAAVAALEEALRGDSAEEIVEALAIAEQVPPLLEKIVRAQIALLEQRLPEAFSLFHQEMPNLEKARRSEDWQGWEQVDFSPVLQRLEQDFEAILAALVIPENATAEQRLEVAGRLMDPETFAIVGRPRFTEACLKAALVIAKEKEETALAFQLAHLARSSGAPPVPCLRVEALALTALGDFSNARTRWVQLITGHPVSTHEPGDYAEAAYTAFENADSRQAMEILNTGMKRFPEDAGFALRAGWVALLTNQPERAHHFLTQGMRIGYPEDKRENATALLTIAAVQIGDAEQAEVHFEALTVIDPAWASPETVETLDWPEDLKAALRQMTW